MNASKDADTYETIAAIQFLLYAQDYIDSKCILHSTYIIIYALHIITLG